MNPIIARIRMAAVFVLLAIATHSLCGQDQTVDGAKQDQPAGESATSSPRTVQLPVFAKTTITSAVTVPDGGTVLIGGMNFRLDDRDALETAGSGTQRFPKCRFSQSGHTVGVVRHPEGNFDVAVQFRFRSAEEIAGCFPELKMDMGYFPKTTNDGFQVEILATINASFQFKDIEEFAKRFPEFCKTWQNGSGNDLVIETPKIEIQAETEI